MTKYSATGLATLTLVPGGNDSTSDYEVSTVWINYKASSTHDAISIKYVTPYYDEGYNNVLGITGGYWVRNKPESGTNETHIAVIKGSAIHIVDDGEHNIQPDAMTYDDRELEPIRMFGQVVYYKVLGDSVTISFASES